MYKSSMYYRGFVDTLAKYGIEKDAAARIYKEAGILSAGWNLIKGIGSAAKGLFTGGKAVVQGTKGVADAAKGVASTVRAAGQNAANVGAQVVRAGDRAKETLQQAKNLKRLGKVTGGGMAGGAAPAGGVKTSRVQLPEAAKMKGVARIDPRVSNTARQQLAAGKVPSGAPQAPAGPAATPKTPNVQTGGVQPSATPQPAPSPTPQASGGGAGVPGGGAAAGSAQGSAQAAAETLKKGRGIVGRYLNFTRNHPLMSTLGTAVGTGFMVNKLNNTYNNNPENRTVNTMTPQESMEWNRINSGNYLPGLGLDPYYFNSAI